MIVDSLFPIQIISSKSGGLCQYSSIVREPSLESNTWYFIPTNIFLNQKLDPPYIGYLE